MGHTVYKCVHNNNNNNNYNNNYNNVDDMNRYGYGYIGNYVIL